MLLAGWVLTVAADDVTPAFDLVVTLALVSFPVVGALVASRRPENAIGWLFCGAGLLFAVATLADGWSTLTSSTAGQEASSGRGSLLAVPAGAVRDAAAPVPAFPGGRPLSRRWRWAVWLAAVAIVAQAAGAALAPGELVDAPVKGSRTRSESRGADALEGLGWALGLTSSVLATASLVLRFRRARGEERLQLKWFALRGGPVRAQLPDRRGDLGSWSGPADEAASSLVLARLLDDPGRGGDRRSCATGSTTSTSSSTARWSTAR